MTTTRLRLVHPAPSGMLRHLEDEADGIRLRPRDDTDNEFIQLVTEQQLVPTLERAWQFKWDRGHARKFMLDLLTIGHTLVASLPEGPPGRQEQRAAYVWYVVRPLQRWPFSRRILWINYLVVGGEFQRQGLGSRIIEHCTEAARQAGCTSIELWVQSVNIPARRFYERHKFIPVRADDGNVLMQKRLQ